MVGRTIGSYTIVEKLGSGGMGEVYFAEHRRIARRAAIKFLLPALSRDADMVARFFNEARATSLIKHPGIVEIYDCDVVDERAYIVMEYLEGESLASAISRTGGFANEIASIVSVAGQIASALAAAHSKGIVHRDLKPENVFLAIEGRGEAPFIAKILDFGIAKLASKDDGVASHTRPGSLLGTPVYMSPEQCRGLSTVDHRADIYALGCIMFELVTGRHVFLRDAPGDLLVAHISETAPTVSSITPGVPVAFDELVARMLAKSPDARPASMDIVVLELEALLGAKAAEFPKMIPPTSRMPLPHLPKSRGTVTSMPAVLRTTPILPDGENREADARGPAVPVGGTQVLSNDSTFRQTASELLPPAERRGRRIPLVLALVAGGGAVAAVTLFLRPAPVVVRPVLADKPIPVPGPAFSQPVVPAAPVVVPPPPPAEPKPADSDRISVRVISDPSGAEIWLAGEAKPRGRTPLDVALPKNSPAMNAIVKKSGYSAKPIAIDPERDQPIHVSLEKEIVPHHHGGRPSRPAAGDEHIESAKPKGKPGGYFGVGD